MGNAFEVLTDLPKVVTCGDSVDWRRADLGADYPVADHTFSYGFQRKEGGAPVNIDGAVVEDAPEFTLTAAQTKQLGVGRIVWAVTVTHEGTARTRTVDQGSFEMAHRAGDGVDQRTQSERDLAAVDEVMSGRITRDVESYSIGDRQITKIPMSELRQLRRSLVKRVKAERGQSGPIAHKAWG